MPSRSDHVRLCHMLDHAREAIALTRGKARADLGRQLLRADRDRAAGSGRQGRDGTHRCGAL